MFKNAIIFRVTGLLNVAELASGAMARTFVSCGPTQVKSFGFVTPRGGANDKLVESVGGQLILTIQTQTKSVPAAEVKKLLDAALDAAEKETGRRPKGKRAKELKEEAILQLLPKAFPKDRKNTIWIEPQGGMVVVDATSQGQAEEAITLLAEICHGVKFSHLLTHTNPGAAMCSWLLDKSGPLGFTIDRECELKQPDGEKAVVRYSRHTLDTDEVGEHIKQGKLPTRLAVTWTGRVSFTLTESLTLKKVDLLDAVLEGASKEEKADAFDADVALYTGELRTMIGDLIGVLGGEIEPKKADAE
jgi:recombination associated protein RdgC